MDSLKKQYAKNYNITSYNMTPIVIKKILSLAFMLLCLMVIQAAAQGGGRNKRINKDSLAAYRLFVNVCRSWQHPPLHINVRVNNTSNYITAREDSSVTEGDFYIRNKEAYIRFGDVEQVMSDTTALLVSHSLHRMVLFLNSGEVIDKMRDMMYSTIRDTSLVALSRKYAVNVSNTGATEAMLTLSSRSLIPATGLPVETIEVSFNPATILPTQIISIKRSLLSLDSARYVAMQATTSDLKNNLFKKENGYYLVKEDKANFIFRKIEKNENPLPVHLADRVIKRNETYLPVTKYQEYRLEQN